LACEAASDDSKLAPLSNALSFLRCLALPEARKLFKETAIKKTLLECDNVDHICVRVQCRAAFGSLFPDSDISVEFKAPLPFAKLIGLGMEIIEKPQAVKFLALAARADPSFHRLVELAKADHDKSKSEKLVRWPGAVLDYLQQAEPNLSLSVTDALLFSASSGLVPCGNVACGKIQLNKGEFKVCGRCRAVKYCSAECQVICLEFVVSFFIFS